MYKSALSSALFKYFEKRYFTVQAMSVLRRPTIYNALTKKNRIFEIEDEIEKVCVKLDTFLEIPA